MRILRAFGVLLLVLAAIIVTAVIMGSSLPHEHVATASVVIAAPQDRVWAIIEDIDAQPKWRAGLKAVEALPPQDGHRCWNEIQSGGHMPLCEVSAAPPSSRVIRIADPNLPYGGTWTYDLQPIDAQSSRLTITENGTTGPALWRFIGHYIMHEDYSIKHYEADLQKTAHN